MEGREHGVAVGHDAPDFMAGVRADVDALRRLTPNWDGHGAPAIDLSIIDAAKEFIARLPGNPGLRPRVVPMSNGSLQLEWHEGPKSLELEFESPRSIRYLQWDPPKGEEEEDSISVDDTDRAADLVRGFMFGTCRG